MNNRSRVKSMTRFRRFILTMVRRVNSGLETTANHKDKMLDKAMHAIKNWGIAGDYLEFGVYRGKSFSFAMKQAKRWGLDLHFYAFDSFEGLPPVDEQLNKPGTFHQHEYACSEEDFRLILSQGGLDLNRVTTVPGFYDKSLNDTTKKRLPLREAAVVWIDCDIYESTAAVLDFVSDYLKTGTVVVFDDWFAFGGDQNLGEIRAANEWLEKNPHIKLTPYYNFGTTGTSFVCQVQQGF